MGADVQRYKVIFSQRSRSDLRAAVVYVRRASQSSEIAARLGASLVQKALSLGELPERGRIVPELEMPDVREIVFKTYRIVFRIRRPTVEILRFWHAARGTPELDIEEFNP